MTYVNPPERCDICTCSITSAFVDGRTRGGPWANMCPPCFRKHGVGLGLGKGQYYLMDDNGEFQKQDVSSPH